VVDETVVDDDGEVGLVRMADAVDEFAVPVVLRVVVVEVDGLVVVADVEAC